MKIILNRTELLIALNASIKAIGNGAIIPILGSYLFEISKTSVNITGGNMSVFITAQCSLKSDTDMAVCIPAIKLQRIVSALPDQELTMTFDNDIVKITCDTGRYSIPYVSGSDYPAVEIVDSTYLRLPDGLLPEAINKTAFAIFADTTRDNLAGLHISCTNGILRIEATDTHVLVTMQIATNSEYFDLLIPKATVPILSGFDLDVVDIAYNKNLITFKTSSFVITSRLAEAVFPNVDGVIPRENPVKVVIDRAVMLSAVRRVSILSNTNGLIKMIVSDGLITLSCCDTELSQESEESLKAKTIGELTIGLMGSQLASVLEKIDAVNIYIEGSTEKRAVLISDRQKIETDLFLIMPLMLN